MSNKTTVNNNNNNTTTTKRKNPTPSNNHNLNKNTSSSSSSSRKIEDSPGYEHIRKAEELEKNQKYKLAIKEYEKGLNLLEKEIMTINNKVEKRQRKEAIDKLRQHKKFIENTLMKKSPRNGNGFSNGNSNGNGNVNINGNNTVKKNGMQQSSGSKPLEQENGYFIIQQAIKKEEENQLKDAIDLYEEGIEKLTETLKDMKRKAEIEKRRKVIEEYRHRQQRCKIQLAEEARVKVVAKEQTKPLEKEKGYVLCEKALDLEHQGKHDAAIKYYEKGLPMLDEYLKTIDNSVDRRQCKTKVDEFRHNLQKMKNLRTKRSSTSTFPELRGGNNLISSTHNHTNHNNKTKKINSKHGSKRNSFTANNTTTTEDILFEPHFNHFRKQSGTIKIISANSQTSLTLPSKDIPLGADGGMLFQIICAGKLTINAIAECDTKDLYHTLAVVTSSIAYIPLPLVASIQEPLVQAFLQKIESSGSLEQAFRCFLHSYRSSEAVLDLFGDHPCLPPLAEIETKVFDISPEPSPIPHDHKEEEKKVLEVDNKETNPPKTYESSASSGTASGLITPQVGEYDTAFSPMEGIPEEANLSEFEQTYIDRDCIWFYRNVFDRQPEPQIVAQVPSDVILYDPMGSGQRVHEVNVIKVLPFQNKPLLVENKEKVPGSLQSRHISMIVVKGNDDLRKDAAVLDVFKFMNYLWSTENLFYHGYPIRALIYNVVAMGADFGVLEYIADTIPLCDIASYSGKFGDQQLENLVASSVASYVATYVLGVSSDNILIRNDGTLFNIDFGSVFGEASTSDTNKIVITKALFELLGSHWSGFVKNSVKAFMKLRAHFSELAEYSSLAFGFTTVMADPFVFLKKRLMVEYNDEIVREKIEKKFSSAANAFIIIEKSQ